MLKFFPLIGVLLLSAAPVQAFETFEELDKICKSSEEMDSICSGAAEFVGTATWAGTLCILEKKGRITKENLVLTWNEMFKLGVTPLSKEAIERTLEGFPDCSIKSIP